ncbi:sensor domain-containing diguanylate cyclase [Ferrovibrio terrae]|uniref:sensor domain-containing diguanylate cyclase n=2 Tax=Ferrovibrio terrae TaxID=2594003 RepID=UPI00313797AE
MQLPGLFNKMSIRAQMTLGTAGLAVFLVAGATLSAAWLGRDKASQLVSTQLAEQSAVMADRLDRDMAVRYQEIGTLIELQPLRSIWQDNPAVLRGVLERLQDSYPDYAWIGFVKLDGTVVAATKGMLEGLSVAQRPWFIGAKDKPFVGDVHEALLLAKLLGPRADNEPFRFVDVAYPVRDAGGTIIGVIGAHLSWDWASDVRQSVLPLDGRFATADISILDMNGRVLLGKRVNTVMLSPEQLAAMRARPSGSGLAYGDNPAQWLTGYAVSKGYRDYPGLGWIVVAQLPIAVAHEPIRDLVGSILLVGAVLGIIGVLIAFWLSGRLAGPIQSITLEADRIGREAGVNTLPRVGGALEVVQLSRALRSLLRRVGMAEQRLEVATRDAESHAAETRELSQDIERLRRLSETDPLTGLLNRRAFLSTAERQVAYVRRYSRNLAIVVADIDHFKLVNDTYGHAAGDAVIREVANRLQAAARETDLVARFGGEEFVVLLMESDVAAAASYAERARVMIQGAPIKIDDSQTVSVTISLGCTILAVDDRDIQDAIDRADGALYGAKAAGRNRVRVSLSVVPPAAATG